MVGINVCRINAKLIRWLDDAMSDMEGLEVNPGLCPLEVAEKFIATEAAWIEHKMTCVFCCGQQIGKVH